MPRHFFIHDTYYGSAPDEAEWHLHRVGGSPLRLKHKAFLCPSCGEVWARAPIEPDFFPTVSREWSAHGRACFRCGSGHILSRHEASNAHTLRAFIPKEILLWEFQLYMKEQHNESTKPYPQANRA